MNKFFTENDKKKYQYHDVTLLNSNNSNIEDNLNYVIFKDNNSNVNILPYHEYTSKNSSMHLYYYNSNDVKVTLEAIDEILEKFWLMGAYYRYKEDSKFRSSLTNIKINKNKITIYIDNDDLLFQIEATVKKDFIEIHVGCGKDNGKNEMNKYFKSIFSCICPKAMKFDLLEKYSCEKITEDYKNIKHIEWSLSYIVKELLLENNTKLDNYDFITHREHLKLIEAKYKLFILNNMNVLDSIPFGFNLYNYNECEEQR